MSAAAYSPKRRHRFSLFMTEKLNNALRECAKTEDVSMADIAHEGIEAIVKLYKKRHKKEGKS